MNSDELKVLQYIWVGQNISYQHGLETQQKHVAQILEGNATNYFLALEHQPIYTIGRTRDKSSLGNSSHHLPHPTIEISRGGQATYHGPGQLTGYPIVDLRELGRDLHSYIRGLEEALILTCAEYKINATRRKDMTGVWVENRKLASIGVGVRKWIAMHGFAINITKESLNGFLSITPCGLDGVTMTCLESEAGKKIVVEEFAQRCAVHLQNVILDLKQKP